MAYTIKQVVAILSNHGMPVENCSAAAEELCARHKADIDSIKEERDNLKAENAEIETLKTQLKEATNKIEAAEKDDYKGKYESEKAAHDKLKADIQTKETTEKKSNAFKSYLKEKGYSENGIAKITKYGDYIKDIELDEGGKIKDIDKLIGKIETEWSEYKPQAGTSNFKPNVPTGTQGTATGDKPKQSRAAEIAAKYHNSLYGNPTNPNKEV